MARTQTYRDVAVSTPLGDDVLLLTSFSGTEHLGQLFEYQLELLSENHALTFDDIVGQNVTVRVALREGATRYFNGHVSRFVQTDGVGRLAQYSATIVPWLWFLTRTADCRIFQEMTVPDIIKQVFRKRGFTDFKDRLSGNYRQWEYCVQYRETDFNFVSRLMEQEGIYYYFEHDDGSHTLVLSDGVSSHDPFPDYEKIPYWPPTQALRQEEHICSWTIDQSVQTGVFALNDYDFEKPKKQLRAVSQVDRKHLASKYEIYDYPGEYVEYKDGESYARTRIEEIQVQHEVLQGQTDARGASTGFTFLLTDHPRKDQCREYLITSAEYQLESDEFDSSGQPLGSGPLYSCSFTAMDVKEPFRSPRITPTPCIPGPQTAIVVGPKGEEIYPDKYGRVKVQFHWDQYGRSDENSSCWIRVAQVWAGKNWGAMFIPRIGQEVIVEFLEGDPDRPIITGRVYNGQCMPPYGLPAEKTTSTIKSDSSIGGGGFNEIRFEDKKGSEQIYIHGQKDQDAVINNNSTETVGNDVTVNIGNDRTVTVGRHETLTVGANRTRIVGGHESVTVAGNRIHTVTGHEVATVGVTRTRTVGAHEAVAVGGVQQIIVGGRRVVQVGTVQVVRVGGVHSLKSGGKVTVLAGGSITHKAGGRILLRGSKIRLRASDIELLGGSIKIKGSSVKIEAKGTVRSKSAGPTIIQGAQVKIN